MDQRPIGVFDTGLGGLTAVRELRRIMPGEDIIYFGDTGRVPYGGRGRETIERYAGECLKFLEKKEVKLIVVACGTVSSVLGEDIGRGLSVPCVGVLAPASKAACAASKSGNIGVIATAATVSSGSYARSIGALRPEARVYAKACPLFVPLVENGCTAEDDPVTTLVAKGYFESFEGTGIDTLILGCTHYPLIAGLIDRVTGGRLALIDSGREAAKAARELLEREGMASRTKKIGGMEFFVTDTVEGFSEIGERFLGEELRGARKVSLDELA